MWYIISRKKMTSQVKYSGFIELSNFLITTFYLKEENILWAALNSNVCFISNNVRYKIICNKKYLTVLFLKKYIIKRETKIKILKNAVKCNQLNITFC